jgi:predicted metal-dependent peptidase
MKLFDQSYYLKKLEDYHRLFYCIFELGNPIYTDSIDTAAVGLNMVTGKINFLINPKFFYGLGEKEQLFIICHEGLHILLSHIERGLEYKLDSYIANIAQDIVINETLVREFGFDRKYLDFGLSLCFIDTVFSEEDIKRDNIVAGKSFEYYYDLLIKNKNNISQSVVTLDFHLDGDDVVLKDENGNIIIEIPKEISDSIIDKIGKSLSEEELDDLIDVLTDSDKAGNLDKGKILSVILEKRRKRPWENLIKKKIASLQKRKINKEESFKFRPRRITNLDKDMYLPEVRDEEMKENDKFNIVFFIDSSGSCKSHQNKFFNLVRSIPEDKFNVRVYSFDTKTYLLDMKDLITKGGGGTRFSILEERVQDLKSNDKEYKKKYPDLIFVLSDGDGNSVYPEKSDRWYFLLTNNKTKYVPKNSNIILVKDFEKNESKITVKNLERV